MTPKSAIRDWLGFPSRCLDKRFRLSVPRPSRPLVTAETLTGTAAAVQTSNSDLTISQGGGSSNTYLSCVSSYVRQFALYEGIASSGVARHRSGVCLAKAAISHSEMHASPSVGVDRNSYLDISCPPVHVTVLPVGRASGTTSGALNLNHFR